MPPTVTAIRLRHPDLVFDVDVTLTEKDGRWLAVAMLADEPDIGTGRDPRESLRQALAALGEPWATEITASVELTARSTPNLPSARIAKRTWWGWSRRS